MRNQKPLSARILSLALSVAMIFTMLPTTVFATEGDALADGVNAPQIYAMVGKQARASTSNTITKGLDLNNMAANDDCTRTIKHEKHTHGAEGLCWAWDNSTKTLTLSGVDIQLAAGKAIKFPAGVATLQLKENTTNTITNTNGYGLYLLGSLTIQGSGSLEVGTSSECIYPEAANTLLTIAGGTITAVATGANAINAKKFTMSGGTLEAQSPQTALGAAQGMNISGGKLTLTGSSAAMYGGETTGTYSIKIAGGDITATATNGIAINTPNLDIIIDGGTGTAEAKNAGKQAFSRQPTGTIGATLTNWNTQKVSWPAQAPDIGKGTSGGCDWVIDADGKLTISPTSGGTGILDSAKWSKYNTRITSVVVDTGVKTPTNVAYLFNGLTACTTMDLSNLDTSATTGMIGMFFNCTALRSLDLSGFNTASVTNMSGMFNGCAALTNLTLGETFTTANVTNMSEMFRGCAALTSLELSKFTTANVTNMFCIFYDCKALTNLDLSGFDTANVTNMSNMFGSCVALKDITLGNAFTTANVTTMESMFSGCTALTNLDLSSFDTAMVGVMTNMFNGCNALKDLTLGVTFTAANATNISSMFKDCKALTSLDLSKFNTAKVTNMHGMFNGCVALEILDLSSFDTAKVTDMSGMFFNCNALTSLDLSSFDTAKVTDMANIFYNCNALKSIKFGEKFTTTVPLPALTKAVEADNPFLGWYKTADGTGDSVAPAAGGDYTNSGVNTIYAKWTKSEKVAYIGTQATVPDASKATKTDTSISLEAQTIIDETVEYGYNTTNTAPTSWQNSNDFTGLSANTEYYFFARVKENDIHNAGTDSTGTVIKTDLSDDEKIKAAKTAVDNALNSFNVTNATDADAILAAVNNALADAGITGVTLSWEANGAFSKIDATEDATGSVTGKIKLTCDTESVTLELNKAIVKLPSDPAEKIALTNALADANNAKIGITTDNGSASSVVSGTKYVSDTEMKALTDSITAAQAMVDKTNPVATDAELIAAATALNNAITTFKAAIKIGTYTSDDGGSSSGGGTTPPTIVPPTTTQPNPPTTVETKVPATVDEKGNAIVNVSDKIIQDAIDKAVTEGKKNGTSDNGISVIIRVTTGGRDANTVTVNLLKTVQEKVVAGKIMNTVVVVDRPDIAINLNLASITEINKQAKADVQLSATRMDNTKLTGEAKTAIEGRPAFDLKATYANGSKAVNNFGSGSVIVGIPYTLKEGETASGLYAAYVDENGKVNVITNSSYDAENKMLRFVTNHFSVYGIGYEEPTGFLDIATHWAKADIEFVANRGLLSGTSKNTFSPKSAMTRGTLVTALGRLAGVDVSNYKTSSFTDVKADSYYMGYIEWANKNGIVKGIGKGKFAPNQAITREQLAVIIERFAKATGYTLPNVYAEKAFADSRNIGAKEKNFVKKIQMAGIIKGNANNVLKPKGKATRAATAAVLHRYIERVIGMVPQKTK